MKTKLSQLTGLHVAWQFCKWASKKSRIKIFKCNFRALVVPLGPWLFPSRLRVTLAAGAGGDGKGKGRKSPFLTFLLPITPCEQLGRDSERRLGTSQAGILGLYQPMLNSNFANLTLTRPKIHTKLHFLIKLINFPLKWHPLH